jgi:hypothetical protein
MAGAPMVDIWWEEAQSDGWGSLVFACCENVPIRPNSTAASLQKEPRRTVRAREYLTAKDPRSQAAFSIAGPQNQGRHAASAELGAGLGRQH